MARRPTSRRVKRHRNYTVDDVARITGVCKGSVRRWLKAGLPALSDRRPILILAEDLVAFLDGRRRDPIRCKPHECYCFSCRRPRAAAFNAVEVVPLSPTSGNLRALCETCLTLMHKRISLAKLEALRAILDVTIMQAGEHISEMKKPCLNGHLTKEAAPHA